jgi:hypothetical protein
MSFASELSAIAIGNAASRYLGAFYGSAEGLAPGAGVIFRHVQFPIYNPAIRSFEARRGAVLILTHECDIDPGNARGFNTGFVLAPITRLEGLEGTPDNQKDAVRNLVRDIAANRINRVFYLPPPPDLLGIPDLPLGGLIYLNAISSGHIDQLADAEAICALSDYAQQLLDQKLENHFFRPKDQTLPRLK